MCNRTDEYDAREVHVAAVADYLLVDGDAAEGGLTLSVSDQNGVPVSDDDPRYHQALLQVIEDLQDILRGLLDDRKEGHD